MTPRRYLATTLTYDNRPAEYAESLQDEITALRRRMHELLDENATLSLQNAELAELVKVRDEQIASFNDLDHGIAGSAVPPINP